MRDYSSQKNYPDPRATESLSGLNRFLLARTGHAPAAAGPTRYRFCNGAYGTGDGSVIKRRAPGRSACAKQPLARPSAERPLHGLFSKPFPYSALQDRHLDLVDNAICHLPVCHLPRQRLPVVSLARSPARLLQGPSSAPSATAMPMSSAANHRRTMDGEHAASSSSVIVFHALSLQTHSILEDNTPATPSTCMHSPIRTAAGGPWLERGGLPTI